MSEQKDDRPLIERLVRATEPGARGLVSICFAGCEAAKANDDPQHRARVCADVAEHFRAALRTEAEKGTTAERLAVALLTGDTDSARVLMDMLRDEWNWQEEAPGFAGREELLRILRALEWCDWYSGHGADAPKCPECGAYREDGRHHDGCRLALALR